MPGEHLIYLTAFGETFADYARKCIHTLRHPGLGNYGGRILVYTDSAGDPAWRDPDRPGSATETRRLMLPEGRDRGYWALRARVLAGSLIDHDAYDRIAYLDCDVLAQRDLSPLFEGPEALRYHFEPWPLWTCQYSNAFLTSEEMREAEATHRRSVNAGAFVVPGRLARHLFARWGALMDTTGDDVGTSDNPTPDQSALNAMILRGEIPAEPLPHGFVANPDLGMSYPEARLFHFTGGRKLHPKGFMHRYRELTAEPAPCA